MLVTELTRKAWLVSFSCCHYSVKTRGEMAVNSLKR